jgi:hypothetical protein
MTKTIPLTQGKIAIVDDEDFEKLNKYRWHYNKGYAVRTIGHIIGKQKAIYMHRYLMKPTKNKKTDHIDGNGLNNQRRNLRVCSQSQNTKNRRINKNNKSGFIGVSWHMPSKKWLAKIKHNNKTKYVGTFDDKIEAAKARDDVAKQLRGDFVVLNIH